MNNYEYELSDLLPIVSKLVVKYTSGESSSVSFETASQLMEAVEYCIQENRKMDLASLDEEEETCTAIKKNQTCTAEEAYRRGYQIVVAKCKQVQKIYNQLSVVFQSYGNENCDDTVRKGIPGFLTHYDARFYPQNHILTMDYPLLSPIQGLYGVDVILAYLRKIAMEQRFLRLFPVSWVESLLAQYHSDYETLFLNLAYPVLSHILCSMMIKKNIENIEWNQEEYNQLEQKIQSLKRSQMHSQLKEILHQFLKCHTLENQELCQYLQDGVEQLVPQMYNAVQNQCIETLFHQG